jgi:hypothetical protein
MNAIAQIILACGVSVFLYFLGDGLNNVLGALAIHLRKR